MRQVAREAKQAKKDVGLAVREAMNDSGVYSAYHQLCLVGSEDVVVHARAAIDALTATRDLLIDGADIAGDGYVAARENCGTQWPCFGTACGANWEWPSCHSTC